MKRGRMSVQLKERRTPEVCRTVRGALRWEE
jgi:hypothetical protein